MVLLKRKIKNLILAGEHDKLIKYENLENVVTLATPNAEHYLPLLYALTIKGESEPLKIFGDAVNLDSISMNRRKSVKRMAIK